MRVVLIDDAAVSRAVFVRFARAAGIEVVGEAADGTAGLALAAQLAPDAVVVDGRIPPDGAVAVVARIHAAHPSLRILVVAALEETTLVRAAREAGASGALLRPILASQLARAFAAHAPDGEDASPPDFAN